jgi:hypothetical protein
MIYDVVILKFHPHRIRPTVSTQRMGGQPLHRYSASRNSLLTETEEISLALLNTQRESTIGQSPPTGSVEQPTQSAANQ